MTTFLVNGNERHGYLALPKNGAGRGILVLHAWWGLNDFFKLTCDRLAKQGYVVFAPDLHLGKQALTIEEASYLVETQDVPAVTATAAAATQFLQSHPAVTGSQLGLLGFSMGAAYALILDEQQPSVFSSIALVYGMAGANLAASQARFQCHFAEIDDYESLDEAKKMSFSNAEIFIYPGVGHWFFEEDRPDAYNMEAARLAWQRMIEFFNKTLP
jgi:carboxymethylenebutenolidase